MDVVLLYARSGLVSALPSMKPWREDLLGPWAPDPELRSLLLTPLFFGSTRDLHGR